MAQVDPDDDQLRRFVVFHHRYDPARRERRPVLVAAFDDPVEFEAFMGRYHADLQARIADGRADPGEYVSGVVWQPGDRRRARQRRMVGRAIRHGVTPGTLFGQDLGSTAAVPSSRDREPADRLAPPGLAGEDPAGT